MMQTNHATGEVSPLEIKQDIARVTDTLGHPPNTTEYSEHGRHSVQTVLERFGPDWEATLRKLEYDPSNAPLGEIPDDDLKADLRRVAFELGHPPRKDDYRELGKYGTRSADQRGENGWAGTLRFAGLDPDARPNDRTISDEELVFDLRMGALVLGHTPSSVEINRYGEYAASTYTSRYGRYENAPGAAGLPPVGEDLSQEMIQNIIDTYDLDLTAADVPLKPEVDDNAE